VTETVSAARERERQRPTRASEGLWPPPREAWLPIAGVVLLYAGHFFYGALISDTSMLMGMAGSLILGACLIHPKIRDDLLRLKGLEWPGLLFAMVLLVALWTLTPWTLGGPHPIWAYVGVRPGASTIDFAASRWPGKRVSIAQPMTGTSVMALLAAM
jgi:hypothetical protein